MEDLRNMKNSAQDNRLHIRHSCYYSDTAAYGYNRSIIVQDDLCPDAVSDITSPRKISSLQALMEISNGSNYLLTQNLVYNRTGTDPGLR